MLVNHVRDVRLVFYRICLNIENNKKAWLEAVITFCTADQLNSWFYMQFRIEINFFLIIFEFT